MVARNSQVFDFWVWRIKGENCSSRKHIGVCYIGCGIPLGFVFHAYCIYLISRVSAKYNLLCSAFWVDDRKAFLKEFSSNRNIFILHAPVRLVSIVNPEIWICFTCNNKSFVKRNRHVTFAPWKDVRSWDGLIWRSRRPLWFIRNIKCSEIISACYYRISIMNKF